MKRVGIRDLKNQLSRYLREVAQGQSIEVTDRGRVVAVLLRPDAARAAEPFETVHDQWVAAGRLAPAARRPGDLEPLEGSPAGFTSEDFQALVDEIRGD